MQFVRSKSQLLVKNIIFFLGWNILFKNCVKNCDHCQTSHTRAQIGTEGVTWNTVNYVFLSSIALNFSLEQPFEVFNSCLLFLLAPSVPPAIILTNKRKWAASYPEDRAIAFNRLLENTEHTYPKHPSKRCHPQRYNHYKTTSELISLLQVSS